MMRQIEREERVTGLTDIIDKLSLKKIIKDRIMVFRGQANSNYYLNPALFRNAGWEANESEMIRSVIVEHPQEFINDHLMLDKLVRLAHYGLPTRLMDVTSNLLVAVYFACKSEKDEDEDGALFVIMGSKEDSQKFYDSDKLSVISNVCNLDGEQKDAINNEIYDLYRKIISKENKITILNKNKSVKKLVQFIRQEKSYFSNSIYYRDLKKPLHVLPRRNNKRIVTQQGSFIIFGLTNDLLCPAMDAFTIHKYIIPKNLKTKILKQLELMGIHGGTVFPEIDKVSNFVAERYKA